MKTKKIIFGFVILSCSLTLLSSCTKQATTQSVNINVDDAKKTPKINKIESVNVSSQSVNLLVGETKKLTATTKMTDESTSDEVNWETSDGSIVTVNEMGELTAMSEGTATITVVAKKDAEKKSTVSIFIKNKEVPKNPLNETVANGIPVNGEAKDIAKQEINVVVNQVQQNTQTFQPQFQPQFQPMFSPPPGYITPTNTTTTTPTNTTPTNTTTTTPTNTTPTNTTTTTPTNTTPTNTTPTGP